MPFARFRIHCLIVTVAAAFVALIVPGSAIAAAKPITGKLSKKGFTVIALGYDGKATSVTVKGKFKLTPPGAKFTVHFRDADGNYAGPLVVGKRGKKVIVGVKAGAKLGKIKVKKGYFEPGRKLGAKALDSKRTATAKKKAPLGAGKLGRVKATAKGSSGTGLDLDNDGIPGAFDVDDDGDLLLDNFDKANTASVASRRAYASACDPPPAPCDDPPPPPPPPPGDGALLPPPPGDGTMLPPPGDGTLMPPPGDQAGTASFRVFSNYKLALEDSLNANAGVTDAQIDATMQKTQTLAIQVTQGSEVELDCGGLTYCSTGGTGQWLEGGAFPGEYDTDGDGFGILQIGSTGDFQLKTGAKAAEIGSGNTMIQYADKGDGTQSQIAGVLNYVFSTTPALVSYSTGGGASGDVKYPVMPGSPGTMSAPITVTDDKLTMTFWRPQRKAIPGSGEGDGWVDIGHLRYVVDIPNPPGGGGGGRGGECSSAYVAGDPNGKTGGEGVEDLADDKPADPANTLTFTFDFAQCFAERGVTWSTGEMLKIDIQAKSNDGDNAAQMLQLVKG